MKNIYLLVASAAMLSGCIVGRVASIDANGVESNVVGATVWIYPCDGSTTGACAPIGPLTTDSYGYYAYDAYATGSLVWIEPDSNHGTYKITVDHPSFNGEPHVVYHQPEWLYNSTYGEYYTFAPAIYLTPTSDSTDTDTDNDGVTDDLENRVYDTDPNTLDTDNDGIPDGSEVYGNNWAAFPDWGTDPLHRDIVVEVDVARSAGRGGFPTPGYVTAIQNYYDTLPIANPDGVDGINVALVFNDSFTRSADYQPEMTGTPMPAGLCAVSDSPVIAGPSIPSGGYINPRWSVAGMRYVQFCPCKNTSVECSPGGIAEFPFEGPSAAGSRMQMVVNWDQNATNDQTEYYGGVAAQILAHEIGHTLYLSHGGGIEGTDIDDTQIICPGTPGEFTIPSRPDEFWKINYPSLMNYAYRQGRHIWVDDLAAGITPTFSLDKWDSLGFSDGSEPDLNEWCMSDGEAWFTNGPKPDYLEAYMNWEDGGSHPNSNSDMTWINNGTPFPIGGIVFPNITNADPRLVTVWQWGGGWIVDWDGDGIVGDLPNTSSGVGAAWLSRWVYVNKQRPMISRDYDDISAIEEGLPKGVVISSPVYNSVNGEDFTVNFAKDGTPPTNWNPPSNDYLPEFNFTALWDDACPGEVNQACNNQLTTPETRPFETGNRVYSVPPGYIHYPGITECGFNPPTCTYTPLDYATAPRSGLCVHENLNYNDAPKGSPSASGLSGAEEVVLKRFTRQLPENLKPLIEDAGLTEDQIRDFTRQLYNPKTYNVDEETRQEARRERIYERIGKFVDFVDCQFSKDSLRDLSPLTSRQMRHAKRPKSAREIAAKLETIEVCR